MEDLRLAVMKKIFVLGQSLPRMTRNLDDVSSPKFKKFFESIYTKEKALQKAEYGDLFEHFGEIPNIRFNAQAIARFDTYTANILQNIKSEKLRKALTELTNIGFDSAKKGQGYGTQIRRIIEDAATLDPIKDKKMIDEIINRAKELESQFKKIADGGFVWDKKIKDELAQLNEIVQIPATSRGEIMSVNGRVHQAWQKNEHLRKSEKITDFEESMKNEHLVKYFNDDYSHGKAVEATCYTHPKDFDDFLYKEYYLKRARTSDIKNSLNIINDDFGTKVFLPHNATDEAADDVLREFYAWNKAGGKDVNWEKTLSFDDYDDTLWHSKTNGLNGCGGYASPKNYITIRSNHLKIEEDYPIMRHERLHRQDFLQRFGKFGKNEEFDFTEGSKILTEKTWYRNEFRKAGIPEWHIDYAYTNRAEFIAVAAEGNPKLYSDEFKQVLIDLGMPEWFFGIRKFKSYNC